MYRHLVLRRPWLAYGALAVSLLSLAACGGNANNGMANTAGATGGPAPSGMASATPSAMPSAPDCTKATKTTISEKATAGMADAYAFTPAKLTIPRGGFLAVVNTSDEVHALVSTPDAGIVTSTIDKNERQIIQFPKAGTFTLKSADAKHRAVLTVTVSGESGCGAPAQTIAITEVPAGTNGAKVDLYSFTPKTLTVKAAENFAVVNKSDESHTITCTPDAGGNKDNSTLDKAESQLLALDKPGKYTCVSTQHMGAKVTITVTG